MNKCKIYVRIQFIVNTKNTQRHNGGSGFVF